jgi:hypothetical protein
MYISGNNATNSFDNSNNNNTFVPTGTGAKLSDNNDFLNQKNDETAF